MSASRKEGSPTEDFLGEFRSAALTRAGVVKSGVPGEMDTDGGSFT